MWTTARRLPGVLLLLAVFVGGCQPFKEEKHFEIGPGQIEDLTVSAPTRDQAVKVTFKATGSPVSVYLVLEKNSGRVQELLRISKPVEAGLALASKENAEEGTIEGKVPAQSEYTVLVLGGTKKANVDLKITGS